ncbi:hypothetical protein GX888_02140 [Candidatus Dojkabacteria bacterium]|uniref:Uncharacterized protein n=1 Tax=Candidatus Dojkabacteria bacterium TaxID=2099670 RepID=A0A847VDE7_9BACT|nr:hypothetical protein [Candidatus Dojkabacteria bacterium]
MNDINLFVTQDGWKKVKKLDSNILKNGNDVSGFNFISLEDLIKLKR